MHKWRLLSFFFTNKTGAPHGEALGLIKFFARRSSNYTFNSLNSSSDIRYGAMEIGLMPCNGSIEKLASLSGGKISIFRGNTSGKFLRL